MAPQASQTFRRVKNPNGACVSTVSRTLIEQDGLTLQRHSTAAAWSAAVNDWRLPAAERAKAYAKTLTIHEKIAQLFVADWRMAKYPRRRPERPPKLKTRFTMKPAWLDEDRMRCRDHLWQTASDRHDPDAQRKFLPPCHSARQRHPRPTWADWINQVNAVCEECDHFIPMSATSNSRNENGELVYGMNDAFGVLATWPGTLGIAAAVKGTGRIDIIDKFADTIRREWNACGMRKGYMYMADTVTDPRWQRHLRHLW